MDYVCKGWGTVYRYSLRAETLSSSDLGTYRTYGILAYRWDKDRWICCAALSDVSPSRTRVQDLVDRCSVGQLDPIHLPDVVTDFLNSVT